MPITRATIVVGNSLIADVYACRNGGACCPDGKGTADQLLRWDSKWRDPAVDRSHSGRRADRQIVKVYRGSKRESYSTHAICQSDYAWRREEPISKSTMDSGRHSPGQAGGAGAKPTSLGGQAETRRR